MRLLHGTVRKTFLKWRHTVLMDLPQPLSFLSSQRKKFSLCDLLLISPCCHLFTTRIAVVASKLIALLITPTVCLVLNQS